MSVQYSLLVMAPKRRRARTEPNRLWLDTSMLARVGNTGRASAGSGRAFRVRISAGDFPGKWPDAGRNVRRMGECPGIGRNASDRGLEGLTDFVLQVFWP